MSEPIRAYQCPGCWSITTNPMIDGGYECECGERLFRIDLRDTEPSPFAANPSPDGSLDALRALSAGATQGPWHVGSDPAVGDGIFAEAAFIVAAVNYVRARLAASDSPEGPA